MKISKESQKRFNHDKNVVDARNRVSCPINEQADLHSDEMLNALFDNGEYVLQSTGPDCYHYEALGFVYNIPVVASYTLKEYGLDIDLVRKDMKQSDYVALRDVLPARLTDEQVKPEITANEKDGHWYVEFYYTEAWVEENLG